MAQHLHDFVYPLQPLHRTRPPGQDMQVLSLGLPRSGTDSLRTALLRLGYKRIWHGFDLPSERPNDCVLWVPLLRAAARGDRSPARSFDWDVLLGDCDGIMDMPPLMFAEELLNFYPDANVILNRRRDMDAWHRSLNEAAETVLGSWVLWVLSWFDVKLRWWYTSAVLCMGIMGSGEGGFQRNGKRWGMEYYQRLERKLKEDGRGYLNWEVQDGWEPLCTFLRKEVPDEAFPWQNQSGKEFEDKANRAVERMVKRSMKTFGFVGIVMIGLGLAWMPLGDVGDWFGGDRS